MPRLSRWLVRTALAWLLAALALGVALAFPTLPARWPALAAAWPVYLHLFVVGWITQLIAGVAYWMFPRVDRTTPPDDPRGWWVYATLNLGLALRAGAEPWAGTHWAGVALPLSAALQLCAAVIFVITLWPRARGR
ncbi:MAG TPA: hypothetical protein VFI39_12150 [Gemmatimonadales bacterium]|nr:hypothetical protein [Gemmatimonadales bacterium]